ncbi:MAG: zinc transporter, family [Frankiales bacterium]|jgi:ZIP family zinc transporter|nr:zinc transporter, family [Frankiales bacterium]
MSTGQTLLLGAIAGSTIFIGLPLGRMRSPRRGFTALLTAIAVGILTFLIVDIFAHAAEPVEGSLDAAVHDNGSVIRAAGLSLLFVVGLAVGLLSLVYYDRWRGRGPRLSEGALSHGPGAAAVTDFGSTGSALGRVLPASRLAMLIAVGIGLHNFAEGLAIGQSAASGQTDLAMLLIIGFALHNATEGFGIVAPMTADAAPRPTWGYLLGLGAIGGAPTFLGTIVGHAWVNDYISVAFLTLAAGSILYVVVELLAVLRRLGSKETVAWGLLIGLTLGFFTDFVLAVSGG